MKKIISLLLVALLALSMLTTALAITYTDKDTVKKVQQALNDAGYNCGTPDGVAGKKTTAAISQYQTDKGLTVSGVIDDALLEVMGLAEAGNNDAPATGEEEQAEAEQPASAEDLQDPKVLAGMYNAYFLQRLERLGVDVQKEDIGQKAYLVNSLYDEGWGYSLLASDIYIVISNEDSSLELRKSNGNTFGELSFLDYTSLYAFCRVGNIFFNGSEADWQGFEEFLGDGPDREGEVSFDPDAYMLYETNLYGLSYAIAGYNDDIPKYMFIIEKPRD